MLITQIVVGKELEQKDHAWIKALSDKVQEQEMREPLERISRITHKFDRELADSVLEVSIRANRQVAEGLRGGDKMCREIQTFGFPGTYKLLSYPNLFYQTPKLWEYKPLKGLYFLL